MYIAYTTILNVLARLTQEKITIYNAQKQIVHLAD